MISINSIPHILKYMGGKREMLTDIHNALAAMDVKSETLCDLFAGTSVVAYAMSDEYDLVVNDIQHYSEIFAKCYMNDYSHIQNIDESVNIIKEKIIRLLQLDVLWKDTDALRYNEDMNYQDMLAVEAKECEIIEGREEERGFSLFKRCYSGTYWSYEQCRHIDAIRAVCEQYRGNCLYEAMMASLIYAMSYSSQSTGHFAQYRTLTEKNYQDILQYRMKNVFVMFLKKLKELLTTLRYPHTHTLRTSSLDYEDCIATLQPGTIVYADPPYNSREYVSNYHILETIARYDYPEITGVTGVRPSLAEQKSVFCKQRTVEQAFEELIRGCHCRFLLISYNTEGLLSSERLVELCQDYALDNSFRLYQFPYRRYKSRIPNNDEGLQEQLFFLKRR